MKRIIFFTIAFFCGIFMNSCNQDLLDIKQHGSIDPDTYYINATDDQAEQLIASIYSQVYTGFFWNGFWNSMSDDGVNGHSNVNANPQNHPGNGYFTNLYRINYLCNRIIEKLPSNSDRKNRVIGEAYFWRAWANIYLIRLWGTPPLVDRVLKTDELTPPNGTPEQLWKYVETSLEKAITLLPEKTGLGQQRAIAGRVSKHAAYSMLGKAFVIQGNYQKAITTLENVINSGKYKLWSDYRELYHLKADFCDEYIWEWNIDDTNQANNLQEGDNRAVGLTWRTEYVTVPGGLTGQGWGYPDLNKNLYDFMVKRGEKGKPRYLGTIWDYEDIQQRFVDLGLAKNPTEAISKFWKSSAIMTGCQGYFRAKMLPWANEVFTYVLAQDARTKSNWPGMRYAEVLLLYSEACVQSGTKTSQGLAALNDVRIRAGLTGLSSYNLQDLKDEKRAELAYESERYLDLVRWGDAPNVLNNRGKFVYTFYGYKDGTTEYNIKETPVQSAEGFRAGRDELFPIPYNEKLLNPNLKQNPNWE